MHLEDNSFDLRDRVKTHFEMIAPEYDTYKEHSAYYYLQLKLLLKELLKNHSNLKIIEIGCGTGSLLADLHPKRGLGIDISENMIRIANARWAGRSELQFKVGEAERLELMGNDWDVIILSDVLEHLYDPAIAIKRFAQVFSPGTRLIITWANRIWEPVLNILERLKMKMPEGDHNWESLRTVRRMLREADFQIESEETRCLIPARMPFSNAVNRSFRSIPIIRRLGLIQFIDAKLMD